MTAPHLEGMLTFSPTEGLRLCGQGFENVTGKCSPVPISYKRVSFHHHLSQQESFCQCQVLPVWLRRQALGISPVVQQQRLQAPNAGESEFNPWSRN